MLFASREGGLFENARLYCKRLTKISHVLQELTVSSFVPNDTLLVGGLGDDASNDDDDLGDITTSHTQPSSSTRYVYSHREIPSLLVLTGPNYSGKSVYLKQVALIVFMAHVGSFVPAESARIGLTDKILSRVTTRRSLLIIDEFGKGTESSDGAGLACAVMEHLLSLGAERPKVIGATHFHGGEYAGMIGYRH
jgi:DNA mismatch repair protein MSH5